MIYGMNYKEFKKLLKDFGKTVYGKSMFVICYTPFFLCFLICLRLAFIEVIDFMSKFDVIALIVFTIILLCIGSFAYYNQLRIFAEKRNNEKKE